MKTPKPVKRLKNSLRMRFPRISAVFRRHRLRHDRIQLQQRTPKNIFTEYYSRGGWHTDSPSGIGSTPGQTRVLRTELPHILSKYQIRTVLDIPCGDFQWMNLVQLKLDSYVGADIVEELIRHNREQFGDTGTYPRSFRQLDLITDPLPQADMVMCRDCLIHFSHNAAMRALANIKASGCRLLFSTTYTDRRWNDSIATGQFYPINLQAPPFRLPRPILLLNENCTIEHGAYHDRSLGLWRATDIPDWRNEA